MDNVLRCSGKRVAPEMTEETVVPLSVPELAHILAQMQKGGEESLIDDGNARAAADVMRSPSVSVLLSVATASASSDGSTTWIVRICTERSFGFPEASFDHPCDDTAFVLFSCRLGAPT